MRANFDSKSPPKRSSRHHSHHRRDRRDHDERSRSRSPYSKNKQNKNIIDLEQLELESLEASFEIDLPCDFIEEDSNIKNKFDIELVIEKTPMKINKEYGDNTDLIEKKNKITPYYDIWEKKIKFLINDFELIDIYRHEKKAKMRYNQNILKYKDGNNSRKGLDQIFSRAYFKLWEVISTNQVLRQFRGKGINIANLAEGPGGFIQCLIDFRNKDNHDYSAMEDKKFWMNDKYYAITLKIENEKQNALDWEFFKSKNYFDRMKDYKYSINLTYGKNDGNMLKTENLRYFVDEIIKQRNSCELVTADGGIELKTDSEYALQELYNVKLFFSEAITAFACQKIEGVFIMKIYESFFDNTIDILRLLTLYYNKVKITKPHMSRPASSERYVVCDGFKGITEEELEKLYACLDEWVKCEPDFNYLQNEKFVYRFLKFKENNCCKFNENLKESNEDCIIAQVRKIEEGLKLCEDETSINNEAFIRNRKKEQVKKAVAWCKKNKIPTLKEIELSNN